MRPHPWITASAIACSMALLSAASPVATRHLSWAGAVIGKPATPIRGDVEMYGAKIANATYIELRHRNDSPGKTRAWQMRRGTCARDQGPFGDLARFPVLRVNRDGTAVGKATVPFAIPDTGDFHVIVAESRVNSHNIIGCGDLYLED